MTTPEVLLLNAQVIGLGIADVLISGGSVASIRSRRLTEPRAAVVVDCDGAALLPGLHDHHCHLLASAAAKLSVQCGPPGDADELGRKLRCAVPGADGWVRGVGYDEAVAGDLDASALDSLTGQVPTRIQHRSGALWVVNSRGASALDLAETSHPGVERDSVGRPTGRLWRMDDWLREQLGPSPAPDLRALSAELAGYGIVGVTDATPDLSPTAVSLFASSDVVQHLMLLGAAEAGQGYVLGPRKIVIPDDELPTWDELAAQIGHARPRPVALHSVTRASLVLALSVLSAAGTVVGDRIEHAAVAPPETVAWMARLGLTVVTQPSLVRQRGDDYLDRADQADLGCLWPLRSLLDAGVRVGLSSDAPYGSHDPWSSIAAAVSRRTISGREILDSERVTGWQALRAHLTSAADPGGAERLVVPGAAADLVLLDRSLDEAMSAPADVGVRLTLIDGQVAYHADGGGAGR